MDDFLFSYKKKNATIDPKIESFVSGYLSLRCHPSRINRMIPIVSKRDDFRGMKKDDFHGMKKGNLHGTKKDDFHTTRCH